MIRTAIIGVVAGLCAGVLVFLLTATHAVRGVAPSQTDATSTAPASVPGERIPANIVSQELLDGAFRAAYPWMIPSGARIILVPHHLVAARGIASLMAATPKPSVVYLISPDHFTQGKTTLTTTDRGFTTPFGDVANDPVRVAALLNDVPSLRNNAGPFAKEHGVTGLIPFIGRAWPGVPVVPIIVRIDAKEKDRIALADSLVQALKDDPNALLVSSIDFSHYLPAEVADFHDVLAQDVVASLADLEADHVEIDSPGALGVTLKVARRLGLGNVTIHDHTNSLRLLNATIAQDSTSHILASFAPGDNRRQSTVSLLFMGDMMFDRTVADRIMQSRDPAYTFEKIRGDESRFFWGQDLVVANLEGPVAARALPEKSIDFAFSPKIPPLLKSMHIDAVSQANNHSLDQGRSGADASRSALQASGIAVFGDEVRDDATSSLTILERRGQKIALLGFNTTDNPLDETAALESIRVAHNEASRVVVFMHWGQEYSAKPIPSQVERSSTTASMR